MLKKLFTVGFFTYCIFISNLIAKDTIIVSIPPQKYFIEQIAKEHFNIKAMMDDSVQSEVYTPTAGQYVWAEDAIAYFKIGIHDEKKWIQKIKIINKNIQSFDTTINIKQYKNDIYTWLDPLRVRIQAKNILNALIALDKKNKDFYRKNYFTFINKVSRIDFQIRTIFKKTKQNNFMVFSPNWGYFARRYNLNQLELYSNPLDIQDKNIVSILNKVNRLNSNVLFIPKYYFPKELYNRLDEKTKVILAPISYLDYDWENNLLSVAKIIANQKN